MAHKLDEVLAQRGKTHGDFTDHARATQMFKDVFDIERGFRSDRGQPDLTPTMIEAIEMVLHKIGRILAGDPFEPDHWRDIAGYATITADRIPVPAQEAATDAHEAGERASAPPEALTRTDGATACPPRYALGPLETALKRWRGGRGTSNELVGAIDAYFGTPVESWGTNAVKWAQGYIRTVTSPGFEVPNMWDEGFMVGWFANAIETGRTEGYKSGYDEGRQSVFRDLVDKEATKATVDKTATVMDPHGHMQPKRRPG